MDLVIGLVFLFAANGELVDAPRVTGFETMEQCLAVREELKQLVASDPAYSMITLKMACVTPEAFQ